MQTNFISAIAAYDNRQPLTDDVANQIILALNHNGFVGVAVTVNNLVNATMMNPLGGTNTVSIQLESPDGTTTDEIIAWVTDAILSLNLWTSNYLSVVSVEVN